MQLKLILCDVLLFFSKSNLSQKKINGDFYNSYNILKYFFHELTIIEKQPYPNTFICKKLKAQNVFMVKTYP